MAVRIKICGIMNLEDALACVDAGADALGFVFYRRSPRYLSPIKARGIIGALPKKVIKAGVFVNPKAKSVKDIAKLCSLDILQFHGSESPLFIRKFKGYKVVKAFRIKESPDLPGILKYKAYAYLFDTFNKDRFGGTGRVFNWRLLSGIKGLKRPVFVSGGLNAGNVLGAIRAVRPDWVDVSSSLENKPGKKDRDKVIKFIRKVKNI